MHVRIVVGTAVLAVASAIASDARAGDVPEESTTIDPRARDDPSAYRGRKNPTTVLEALAWVPRVVCYPLYLTTDLLLRRPIYGLVDWIDESNALVFLRRRIFEPSPHFSWFPTFWFDLGTPASVGLEFSIKNVMSRRDELHLVASTGGLYFWHFGARERVDVGPIFVGARGDYLTRRDRNFYGLGPYSTDEETHFRQTRYEAAAFVGVDRTHHFNAELSGGARGERSGPGDEPSIETRFDPRTIPGYEEPINLIVAKARVALDSRATVDGWRRALSGEVTYCTRFLARHAFVRRDESRRARRVRDLEAGSRLRRAHVLRRHRADRQRSGPLHRPADARLRQSPRLRMGRFRGESAVLAEVQYRYPIAYYFDALWTVSSGNVFKRDLSDFNAKALTMSFGLALRSRRWGLSPLDVGFALGTTRFDEPYGIQNVRVYAGVWEGP